jgi:hypothetical protein
MIELLLIFIIIFAFFAIVIICGWDKALDSFFAAVFVCWILVSYLRY